MAKYILKNLQNGSKKILIMTAVPDTIISFKDTLNKYIEFDGIKYIQQGDFITKTSTKTSTKYNIVFCSLQYFKAGDKAAKKQALIDHNFDAIIMDECHLGGAMSCTLI